MSRRVEKKEAKNFSNHRSEKRDCEEEKIPVKYYEPLSVEKLEDETFKIGKCSYRLVYNHREGFNLEKLATRYSEVLSRYNYVVGDWGYEQLRLKGFFYANDKDAFSDQKIDTLVDYLYEFCNFGCSFFVLERLGEAPVLSSEEGEYQAIKKKPKYRSSRSKNQAHIEEKREELPKKKPKVKRDPHWKEKPKGKFQKKTEVKNKEKRTADNSDKKRDFTIRSREK